jgi:hypothetical protein
MRFFKYALQLSRLFLLFCLLLYWVSLIGVTVTKFIQGGSNKVVAYYWYTLCENRLDPCQWSWRVFLTAQFIYLVITLLLCLPEWRSLRKRRKELVRG